MRIFVLHFLHLQWILFHLHITFRQPSKQVEEEFSCCVKRKFAGQGEKRNYQIKLMRSDQGSSIFILYLYFCPLGKNVLILLFNYALHFSIVKISWYSIDSFWPQIWLWCDHQKHSNSTSQLHYVLHCFIGRNKLLGFP